MTTPCIHGFEAQHCARCRTCLHGAVASRCATCRATANKLVRLAEQPTAEYLGFQIYFVPLENSWYYRTADADSSVRSYRSAFQARRAVDALISATGQEPPPTRRPARKGKRPS
jgi:hypothetical protein